METLVSAFVSISSHHRWHVGCKIKWTCLLQCIETAPLTNETGKFKIPSLTLWSSYSEMFQKSFTIFMLCVQRIEMYSIHNKELEIEK